MEPFEKRWKRIEFIHPVVKLWSSETVKAIGDLYKYLSERPLEGRVYSLPLGMRGLVHDSLSRAILAHLFENPIDSIDDDYVHFG